MLIIIIIKIGDNNINVIVGIIKIITNNMKEYSLACLLFLLLGLHRQKKETN